MDKVKEQLEQIETPRNGETPFHSGGVVSISEAARLTGKSRGTLYRHNKSGKLSFSKDDEGNPVVQVAELVRVYKSIKLPKPSENAVSEPDVTVPKAEQNSKTDTVTKEQAGQGETLQKGRMAQVDTLRRLETVQRQLSNERALRVTEKDSLEARIAEIKGGYEARIDDLKDSVKSWQEQAQGSQRLLEHHQQEQVTAKKGFWAKLFS